MTTIVINKKRAIIVDDKSYALAKWGSRVVNKEKQYGWIEYLWCSSMDRCIERLTQEFISDLELTLSMHYFNERWNEFTNKIKEAINGSDNQS